MILLDFYSGSHGHFLEYVINTYIFRGHRLQNIFTPLGTSHLPSLDSEYKKSRIVQCAHFSKFNLPSLQPSKVIRITISELIEKVCYQINLDVRAGDIPQEKKMQKIPASIRNDPALLRNQYYSKFINVDDGYPIPGNWKWNNVPMFDLPMKDLYNFFDFYTGLKQIADFLDHSFNADSSLYALWKQFITMNHGVRDWITCQNLLEKTLANESFEFEATFTQQALLNCLLTKTFGICDGVLFSHSTYPTNTMEIHSEINSFIRNFDSRF